MNNDVFLTEANEWDKEQGTALSNLKMTRRRLFFYLFLHFLGFKNGNLTIFIPDLTQVKEIILKKCTNDLFVSWIMKFIDNLRRRVRVRKHTTLKSTK